MPAQLIHRRVDRFEMKQTTHNSEIPARNLRNTVPDERNAYEALSRLFEQADQSTTQARCVARLLLAWYDASTFGAWDPIGLWDVDEATGNDMIAVLELIKESRAYIDELGFDREIQLVWQRWMPLK